MSQYFETNSLSRDDHTTVDDWRGLGDLLALATERISIPVEGMHHAIADRWFGLAGPKAAPARRAYGVVTTDVYRSVRIAGSALGAIIGSVAAGSPSRPRPLWRSPLGSRMQAVLNASWGDELERRHSSVSIELGLRDAQGRPITSDSAALGEAFPEPTARLVVLLHGLGETERCWQQRPGGGTGAGLADILAADSFTPLLLRYNSGRHVSDNGAALSDLLEEIVHGWPVTIDAIALVGHSMGGLVARSSIHAARAAGDSWVETTRHVVTLGSPHLGSPIEKGANLVSWGLRVVPESRPLGGFVDDRSSGIKDLRFGAIREEDWSEAAPDALWDHIVGDSPLPGGVEQHFVAGVITARPTHPVGVLVGDLIVRVNSSTGRGRRRRIDSTDVRVIGSQRHFDLLRNHTVHEQVRVWLTADTGKQLD